MGKTQADFRRDINPKDQFGRKWQMCIEISTGDPTGGIFPAGWTDPLRTPMKFVKVPRNEDGQAEIGRVVIRYDTWAQEHEEEERKWYQQLHINARDVYKRLDPSDVANLEHDKFLLDLTGPKPWPSPAVIRRAANGERGLLGLEPLTAAQRVDLGQTTIEDLKAGIAVPAPASTQADDSVPPDTYPQFVSWVFRTGGAKPGDLTRAAELWRLHREHLTAA